MKRTSLIIKAVTLPYNFCRTFPRKRDYVKSRSERGRVHFSHMVSLAVRSVPVIFRAANRRANDAFIARMQRLARGEVIVN